MAKKLPPIYFFPESIHWLAYAFSAYARLRKINREKQIDIVHIASIHGCGLPAIFFSIAPTVVRVSSYRPLWNTYQRNPRNLDTKLLEFLEILQLRRADYVICPSNLLCRVISHELGRADIVRIPSPAFLEIAQSQFDWTLARDRLQDREYLLYFGRLQLHKGVHVLGLALREVLRLHPELYAVFVGENLATAVAQDMRQHIRSQVGDNLDRLIFIDHVDHAQLYPIIEGAKLVVLPSLIENFPNACLEAMTLGRPVLGTNGASFEEIIDDGIDGFLCRPGDADDLAEKVKRALRHPNLAEIGKRAQEKAATFGPEKTVGKLLDFYEAVITQRTQVHQT
jgi:glycosyltransferase involved in cell wall biosynthesis